jgi:hypothetical protein
MRNFFSRLEAFARICVSGFLFDPEIFTSDPVKPSYPEMPNGPSVNVNSALSRQPSSRSQGLWSRGAFSRRLRELQDMLVRPFSLPTRRPRHEAPMVPVRTRPDSSRLAGKAMAPGQHGHFYITDASQTGYFHKLLKSDNSQYVSLPFQLSMDQAQDKTKRNMPYLRQGWCRIDFIAIVGFWVDFALATTGLERGSHHIGVFRAMSVMRTARLLTVTSGTAVRIILQYS